MFRNISKKQFGTSTYKNVLEYLYKNHIQATQQPYFKLLSGQIEVLKDPIDFYITLHQGIRNSSQRICLSSLYIGTGNLEKFLVASINSRIKRSKKLRVKILLDYMRGNRLDNNMESSKTLIQELRTENLHNPNINLSFFKNPCVPNIFFSNDYGSLREIFGVHHMKIYIFDNHVLLSGANLSENYFTERQDRYYLIKSAPELANYLEDVIDLFGDNSYQVDDMGNLGNIQNKQASVISNKQQCKTMKHQLNMFLYKNRVKTNSSKTFEEFFDLQKDQDYSNQFNFNNYQENSENENQEKQEQQENQEKQKEFQQKSKSDLSKYQQFFKDEETFLQALSEKKEQAKEVLQASFDEGDVSNIVTKIESALYTNRFEKSKDLVSMGGYVYLFPTLQLPFLDHYSDQILFQKFIEEMLSDENSVKIATGYMNFREEIVKILAESKSKVDLLTASPMANGFYNGGRLKKYIPYFYRVYEYMLLKEAKKNKKQNLQVHEYFRAQWTYHSKGMWFYEKGEEFPSLTTIGSSNFSARSYQRDSELNIWMYSQCNQFKKILHEENVRQFEMSINVTEQNLKKDKEMKLSFLNILFAQLFSTYL